MRYAALAALLLGLPGLGLASFELGLAYDITNRQIIRFDPANRLSLGTFGLGMLGNAVGEVMLSADVNQPGTLMTMDGNGYLRRFDYSSGLPVSSTVSLSGGANISPRAIHMLGSNRVMLIQGNLSSPRLYNASTGASLTTFQSFSGYTTIDCVELSDGTFVSLERTLNGANFDYHLFRRDVNGAVTITEFNIAQNVSAGYFKYLTADVGQVLISGFSGTMQFRRYEVGAGAFFNSGVSGVLNNVPTVTNFALGHGSNAYAFESDTPGLGVATRMTTLDRVSGGFVTSSFVPLTSTNIGQIAVVNAPEPASFLILGLGLVPLLRRKKR